MRDGVQYVALAQPDVRNMVEEIYEEGDQVLPRQPGEFTFFGASKIWTAESDYTPDVVPGGDAPCKCVVIWIKVVKVPQIAVPEKPSLLIPGR